MEALLNCPFCGGEAAIYGADSYYVACCRCEAQTARYRTAQEAIVNWNRRAAPENKALTLEQFRQMDGEPVWVEYLPHSGHKWRIVRGWEKEYAGIAVMRWTDGQIEPLKDYGKTWLAYARRPEAAP